MRKTVRATTLFIAWFLPFAAHAQQRLTLQSNDTGRISGITFPTGQKVQYLFSDDRIFAKRFLGFHDIDPMAIFQKNSTTFLFQVLDEFYRQKVSPLRTPMQLMSEFFTPTEISKFLESLQTQDDSKNDLKKINNPAAQPDSNIRTPSLLTLKQELYSLPEEQRAGQFRFWLGQQTAELTAGVTQNLIGEMKITRNSLISISPGTEEFKQVSEMIKSVSDCNSGISKDLNKMLTQGQFKKLKDTSNTFQPLYAAYKSDASMVTIRLPEESLVLLHALDKNRNLYETIRSKANQGHGEYLQTMCGNSYFDLKIVGETHEAWSRFALMHEFGHVLQIQMPVDQLAQANYALAERLELTLTDPAFEPFKQYLRSQFMEPFNRFRESSACYFALDALGTCLNPTKP